MAVEPVAAPGAEVIGAVCLPIAFDPRVIPTCRDRAACWITGNEHLDDATVKSKDANPRVLPAWRENFQHNDERK
jgi:hypothetical protein